MTYKDFTDKFLLKLARFYRSGEVSLHGLVDIDLWKKVFPDNDAKHGDILWSNVSFNAFTLDDEENSLLIVYSIPQENEVGRAKFIAMRFDNKRHSLLYYTLRRPKYYDDAWDIFQYDFSSGKNYYIQKIGGTDSLREFKASIEKIEFKENPTLYEKIINIIR